MPRTARAIEAGLFYHVLNRGNGRMNLFHKEGDFPAFLKVLHEGLRRYPVGLLTYCLMHNHWHLVLRPRTDESLGKFIGWVGVTHVRRHHEHYASRGGGHLYQGRFKSFPVQDDRHFLTLCRYVEANAVRAGLVKDADDWRWHGGWARRHGRREPAMALWPLDRPRDWLALLNDPMDQGEVAAIRTSVNRGRPWGTADWIGNTARRLKLDFTLRSAGRPRKTREVSAANENNQ